MKHAHVSIWFFIGLLLAIYGVLILGAGLYALVKPPHREVVLAGLHAGIWWGALLLIIGLIYVRLFAPGRRRDPGKEAQAGR
jgi:hypothetical protein